MPAEAISRETGRFRIFSAEARSILSATTGFIAEAGFTHSLTPARNCTFACTYCYVPTMRLWGGLKPEDWQRWGQFTTFKRNAAELARKELRPHQRIYCSPLVDPYQPAELAQCLMPGILEAVIERPPAVFTIQTRGPAILRDLTLLERLHRKTRLRISFSLTTDREEVRKLYEPHCAPIPERIRVIGTLAEAGLRVHATLAPLLPCDPEGLVELALGATRENLIGDPFHTRRSKRHGATTRPAGEVISAKHGWSEWHDPPFQSAIIDRMARVAEAAGRRFVVGPAGFSELARTE